MLLSKKPQYHFLGSAFKKQLFILIFIFMALGIELGLAKTIVPIQGWHDFNNICYYLHNREYSVFWGKEDSSKVIIKQKNGTFYYISNCGELINIDDNKLYFKNYMVEFYPDSLHISKAKNKIPEAVINRYALCYRKNDNRFIRLGKEIKLSKKCRKFLQKKPKINLIDVFENALLFKQNDSLKLFEKGHIYEIPFPAGIEINAVWKGNDTLKILGKGTDYFRQNFTKLFRYSFRKKRFFKDSLNASCDFLSATDGKEYVEEKLFPFQGGMFPLSKDTIFLSLKKYIYQLTNQKMYWEMRPLIPVKGYLNFILPLKDYWMVVQIDKDTSKTFKATGIKEGHPKWNEIKDHRLVFVDVYDSSFVYQLDNSVYYGRPGQNSYQVPIPKNFSITNFVNDMVTMVSPKQSRLEKIGLENNRIKLDLLYEFVDPNIRWIIPLRRLPLPIKYNWQFSSSNVNFTFKEWGSTFGLPKNPISSVLFVHNILFVKQKDNELGIVPLLQLGKTKYPYSVYSIKYAFKQLFLFGKKGLEIGKPEEFLISP